MAGDLISGEVEGLDPAEKRVGDVLDGKWTLDRLLGVGGMAAVYSATHRNGARAAIKLFPFSVTTSPQLAERFLREGYLANKVSHPGVVRVLDDNINHDEEYAYLVMELLEGQTVHESIEKKGPLAPADAIDIIVELCACLEAAHEKGIVHRDIKPENIFITSEDELKVLDFGVARALDAGGPNLTRTGTTLGTPAYMAPEQARGRPKEISPRTDIYAAGATLLYLISGELMHQGESAQEIMVRAAWTPARGAKERLPGLDDGLANAIDKACAFEPEDRFQSATDLANALREISVGMGAGARQPLVSSIPPPGTTRSADAPGTEPTVGESTPPAVPTSERDSGAPQDSTTWIVGVALTAALTGAIIFFWPAAESSPAAESVSPAQPTATSPVAPAAPAKQPTAEMATATAPAPSTNPPAARSGSPTEEAAPRPRETVAAPTPKPSPRLRRRANAQKAPPPSIVATAQPDPQPAPASPPKKRIAPSPTLGRDVGY